MAKRLDVLMVVPRLDASGGIANYYKVLKDKLPSTFEYFIRPKTKYFKLVVLFFSYYKFFLKILFNKYKTIQLSTSFDKTGLKRDYIYIYIAKLLKKKVCVFFRGWHDEYEHSFRSKYLKLYFQSDFLIVLSKEFKEKLILWGYRKPIYVETTVVDDKYIPKYKYKTNKKLNILFLSRIEKYKGIYWAMETFNILNKKFDNISFTVVGNGYELINVIDYAKELNITNIEFTGYLYGFNKYQAYGKADIYFFPSYSEGMPNSVIEAMACGLPVITRNTGGLNDFFINGEMGYMTASKDPKVFTELIEKLILDEKLRKRICVNNYNYAKEHFWSDKVISRLEKIYNK